MRFPLSHFADSQGQPGKPGGSLVPATGATRADRPGVFVLTCVLVLAAAAPGEESPESSDDFRKVGRWITDLREARAAATRRDRPILVYFTRTSPPCPLCRSLEERVLASREFGQVARRYVLHLHEVSAADGGRAALAEAGGEHAPHFAWLDRDGTLLFPHDVSRTVAAFASMGARADRFFSARAAAREDDTAAQLDYAIERAAVGRMTLHALQREITRLGPASDPQRARLEEIRPALEFERVRRALKGERYLDLMRSGFVPAGVGSKTEFFVEILRFAEYTEDAELYARMLARLRRLHGGHDHAAAFFAEAERTLERLRGVEAPGSDVAPGGGGEDAD